MKIKDCTMINTSSSQHNLEVKQKFKRKLSSKYSRIQGCSDILLQRKRGRHCYNVNPPGHATIIVLSLTFKYDIYVCIYKCI